MKNKNLKKLKVINNFKKVLKNKQKRIKFDPKVKFFLRIKFILQQIIFNVIKIHKDLTKIKILINNNYLLHDLYLNNSLKEVHLEANIEMNKIKFKIKIMIFFHKKMIFVQHEKILTKNWNIILNLFNLKDK